MIRIVAENFVKAEVREQYLALAAQLVEGTRKEEGNISYALHVDRADPEHFCFIEEWKDAEAIEKHNNAEHFTRLVPQMAKFQFKPGTCYLYDVELGSGSEK